jgi:cellulose synthase/poly-beta-1,6-N-acetylglucosamine synthase-like glycosyltransferase
MDVYVGALVAYIVLHVFLCVNGLHRGYLQLFLLRARPDPTPPSPEVWPLVTVQLPVYNERDVVVRIIDATAKLDYPRDALQIQVLDDSTDDTTHLARLACERLVRVGFDASVVHREDRTGFKAGALALGLEQAKGDFVAIFDADFLPPTAYLRRTVPYLLEGAGMVQARWGHLNQGERVITGLQAILLDGHFAVEQSARYRGGRWFQFNGTAGIWRKDVIYAAGGWEHDTLTEDLDLSYRAQIAGARFVYLDDLVAPAELPNTMAAFKAQQHRWGKGMVQAFKKSIGRIWRAEASLGHKVEATLHLSSIFAWPLVAILSVLLPIGVALREWELLEIPWWTDLLLFTTATLTICSFYVVGAVRARSGGLVWRLLAVPMAMALGVGLAIAQTQAVFEGLFGGTGVFVRTPKSGMGGQSSYKARVHWMVWIECGMAIWLLGTSVYAASQGWIGATPFMLLFGLGYGLVGFQGMIEAILGQPRSNAIASTAGSQVSVQSQAGSSQVPVAASYPESTP